MKLRSHSSREGNVSQNFDSQVGDESIVDNMSATSKALRNPLILGHILTNLDMTDLKTARLACRYWAELGGSLLGKRTVLHVNELFRYNGSKLFQVTPVTQNLMRHVTISDKFDPSIPTKKTANVITKVFTDLVHVSQVTSEIHFRLNQIKCATGFVNGMRKLKKSNIQQISVCAWWLPGSEEYPACTKKLPVQTNLTSIEFGLYGLIPEASFGFLPLLQILIDSSPNLTSLDVRSSFFPNLEGCKNLKVLKFTWMKSNPSPSPNLDMVAAACGMLAQVKDTLIEMEFSSTDHVLLDLSQPVQGQNPEVPVMSKLVSLSVTPAAVYSFENFFNEDHLPALTNLVLSINNRPRGILVSPHLNLWRRHRGVKSLRLALNPHWLFDAHSIGGQIFRLFPSVKKFELMTYLRGHNSVQDLTQMMTPYRNWDLEEASVRCLRVDEASVLVSVVGNMAIWKGVKRVRFVNTRVNQDDFSASIPALILHSRGFKSVTISGGYGDVVPEILEVLQPIFEGSGAPIRVTGGVVRP